MEIPEKFTCTLSDIKIFEGDSITNKFRINDENGRGLKQEYISSLRFSIKANDSHDNPLLVIEYPGLIECTNNEIGEYQLNLDYRTSEDNLKLGRYVYDIQLLHQSGHLFTIVKGNIIVQKDISSNQF